MRVSPPLRATTAWANSFWPMGEGVQCQHTGADVCGPWLNFPPARFLPGDLRKLNPNRCMPANGNDQLPSLNEKERLKSGVAPASYLSGKPRCD
jgi:hypothetical protein